MKGCLTLKAIYFEDMDHSTAYVHSSNLNGLIKSHRSRPIYKLTSNGQTIFRKIRSKSIEGIDKDSIIIDYISMIELQVKSGSQLSLKKANFWQRWFSYYYLNPIEEVRGAWWYFMIGQLIAVASLIIGIVS
jgi:hypothetical protein